MLPLQIKPTKDSFFSVIVSFSTLNESGWIRCLCEGRSKKYLVIRLSWVPGTHTAISSCLHPHGAGAEGTAWVSPFGSGCEQGGMWILSGTEGWGALTSGHSFHAPRTLFAVHHAHSLWQQLHSPMQDTRKGCGDELQTAWFEIPCPKSQRIFFRSVFHCFSAKIFVRLREGTH